MDNADPDLNHYGDFDVNFTAYDIDSLKNNISLLNNGFNLMHHNSRSLLTEGRVEEYEVLLDSVNNSFHILALSETWLKVDNVDNVIFYGYEHIYNLRPISDNNEDKDTGGGLSFFIKNDISYKVCDSMNLMLPFVESLFIEVSFNQKNYIIGLIYRVPNTNVDNFNDTINTLVEPIRNKHEVILLGDFNIDLMQDNKHTRDFQNMLQSNYLVPTIWNQHELLM